MKKAITITTFCCLLMGGFLMTACTETATTNSAVQSTRKKVVAQTNTSAMIDSEQLRFPFKGCKAHQ